MQRYSSFFRKAYVKKVVTDKEKTDTPDDLLFDTALEEEIGINENQESNPSSTTTPTA